MKKDHTIYSDDEFESSFKSCAFPPHFFTHEAHIRLAWIHLKKYGLNAAIQNISDDIQRFDWAYGKGDKFHKSITVAAVKIVNHFLLKSKAPSFNEFIKTNPRLMNSFMDLMLKHYTMESLNSELAKTEYVEPDLLSFE